MHIVSCTACMQRINFSVFKKIRRKKTKEEVKKSSVPICKEN